MRESKLNDTFKVRFQQNPKIKHIVIHSPFAEISIIFILGDLMLAICFSFYSLPTDSLHGEAYSFVLFNVLDQMIQ